MIQNPLRTPLKLHAPAFLACAAFSLLPLLPSRRPLFPCLLASACLLPPAPLFCLVLSARLVVRCPGWCLWLPLFRGFGLFCWRGLFFVWFGLFGASLCCLSLAGFSVLRILLLLASPHVILDRYIRIFCFHLCN